MIEPTACLTLSGIETVFMSDALRTSTTITAEKDEPSCLRPLVLNLASLYRELVTVDGISAGPVFVEVTEAQAWQMRSVVRTGDLGIDGKTNVGVPLLLKLYAILLELAAPELPLPVGDVEDAAYVKEAVDARPDNDTHSDLGAVDKS